MEMGRAARCRLKSSAQIKFGSSCRKDKVEKPEMLSYFMRMLASPQGYPVTLNRSEKDVVLLKFSAHHLSAEGRRAVSGNYPGQWKMILRLRISGDHAVARSAKLADMEASGKSIRLFRRGGNLYVGLKPPPTDLSSGVRLSDCINPCVDQRSLTCLELWEYETSLIDLESHVPDIVGSQKLPSEPRQRTEMGRSVQEKINCLVDVLNSNSLSIAQRFAQKSREQLKEMRLPVFLSDDTIYSDSSHPAMHGDLRHPYEEVSALALRASGAAETLVAHLKARLVYWVRQPAAADKDPFELEADFSGVIAESRAAREINKELPALKMHRYLNGPDLKHLRDLAWAATQVPPGKAVRDGWHMRRRLLEVER
ncbi:hypothetical protein JCM8202_002836 [Rhodotorula sphaerocarpa]